MGCLEVDAHQQTSIEGLYAVETWCLTFIRSRSEPAIPPSRPLTFTMRYRAIFAEAFPSGFWNEPEKGYFLIEGGEESLNGQFAAKRRALTCQSVPAVRNTARWLATICGVREL